MKKHSICENHVRETDKSYEINVLGLKKSQNYARRLLQSPLDRTVVEAYRLDRYDNKKNNSISK